MIRVRAGKRTARKVGDQVGPYMITRIWELGPNPPVDLMCTHGVGYRRFLYTLNNVAKTKRCPCEKGTRPRIQRQRDKAKRAQWRSRYGRVCTTGSGQDLGRITVTAA